MVFKPQNTCLSHEDDDAGYLCIFYAALDCLPHRINLPSSLLMILYYQTISLTWGILDQKRRNPSDVNVGAYLKIPTEILATHVGWLRLRLFLKMHVIECYMEHLQTRGRGDAVQPYSIHVRPCQVISVFLIKMRVGFQRIQEEKKSIFY